MSQLSAEIAQLEQQLAEAENRKQQYGGQDIAQYQVAVEDANNISSKLARLRAEQEEKEQREQKKQDTINDYVDIVSQMFEALFPSEKYRPLFGITEYEEKRAQFYRLNHAYVTEKIEAIHQENELALALKDERCRLLNDQALAVQQQLDEAKGRIIYLESDVSRWSEKYDELEKTHTEAHVEVIGLLNDTKTRLNAANSTIEQLRHESSIQAEQITTLQEKLEAAQQPKESKPSQKLSDMLTEIKSKNDIQADDWIARWNSRQKTDEAKIPLPEISVPEVTESPFRGEDPTANVEEHRILTPEVPEVAQDSFQNEGDTESGHIEIPANPTNGEVVEEEPVTRAEFEELKRRVTILELPLGKLA